MLILTEWTWGAALAVFVVLAAAPTIGIMYHAFTNRILSAAQKFWYTMWFLFAALWLEGFGINTLFLNEMMDPLAPGAPIQWSFMIGAGMGMMIFSCYLFLFAWPMVEVCTRQRGSFRFGDIKSCYLPFSDEQLSQRQAYLIIGLICGVIGLNQWLKLISPYLLVNAMLGGLSGLHRLMAAAPRQEQVEDAPFSEV